MDEVLEILESLNLDADVSSCEDLVDGGFLGSLDIVTIIAELSDAFDITIPAREIIPANFNSARALWNMVQRLQED